MVWWFELRGEGNRLVKMRQGSPLKLEANASGCSQFRLPMEKQEHERNHPQNQKGRQAPIPKVVSSLEAGCQPECPAINPWQ